MSERLSAEERATRAINKATSAWKTNLKTSPPFWGITQQEVAKEIKLAEKAAAEAEREGLQREHRACEDAYVREIESLRETVQTQSFELEELRKPIADKSICQRGHPKACLVQVKGVGVQGEVGGELKPMPPPPKICIACTQLEAELKPLREVLDRCKDAIELAIYHDDGLDRAEGQVVLGAIIEALRRNRAASK